MIRVLAWAAVLTAVGLLNGCAEYSAGSAAFRAEGRIVAAEALDATLWATCRAAPVGSIIDRFGQNADAWAAYGRMCLGYWQADGPPVPLVK